MSTFTDTSSLIFFKCEDYRYEKLHVFDVSSCPRPHYCMGLIISGGAVFEDSEDGERVSVSAGDIIFVPMGSRYKARWFGQDKIHYISMHFVFSSSESFPQKKRFRFRRLTPPRGEETERLFHDIAAGRE